MRKKTSKPSRILAATAILLGMGCSPAFGQDESLDPIVTAPRDFTTNEYLVGDVPEWLAQYWYEDDLEKPNFSGGSPSQTQKSTDSDRCSCLLCRDKLTGDWNGRRQRLKENGIVYRGRVTQFFFGVDGGIVPPVPPQAGALGYDLGDQFEYTGNSRHDLLFDLDKLSGVSNGKFVVTLENIWGHWGNVSFQTGALTSSVFNALFPVDVEANGVPRVTNFMLVQPLSEEFIVHAGKTRTIGIADHNIFAGGDGSDQFLNQTFLANPLMTPLIPFSTFSVGATLLRDWGNIGLSVMDTQERSTDFMSFGDLFSQGSIVFGQIKVNTDFFDLPGQHHVGAFYRNSDLTDLRFATLPPSYPYEPVPAGTPQFLTRSDTDSFFYGFDQYVSKFGPPNARGYTEGWGIFGRASIADDGSGNPNWGAWHVGAGIGGSSPLHHRRGKGDRFGFGYGYTAASTEFGAIPRSLFGPRDAQLVEAYYRYQLTPAVDVSPDIQWMRGALGGLTDGGAATVLGCRLNMVL